MVATCSLTLLLCSLVFADSLEVKMNARVHPGEANAENSFKPIYRVLVTGGAGFLGSHICRRLVNEGHEVSDPVEWESEHISEKIDC